VKYWSNVCVEGHCFGEQDKNGNNPCGRSVPSSFCLGNGRTKVCPHFAWSDATERDVARFVRIRYILKDRMGIWAEEVWCELQWWFWDRLWFNRRKVDEFFNNIKVIDDNDPCRQSWKEEERKQQEKFEKWFPKAKKEW